VRLCDRRLILADQFQDLLDDLFEDCIVEWSLREEINAAVHRRDDAHQGRADIRDPRKQSDPGRRRDDARLDHRLSARRLRKRLGSPPRRDQGKRLGSPPRRDQVIGLGSGAVEQYQGSSSSMRLIL